MFLRHLRLIGGFARRYCTQEMDDLNNPLKRYIADKIKATGPITLAQYMKEVLTHPDYGYYMHRDMLGPSGDFVTSPELGQMFGEMIAIWFLNEWKKIGAPKPVQIVELGPGRGSLCLDMIRVFELFGEIQHASIELVEVSHCLSTAQARKLCKQSEPPRGRSNLCYRRGLTPNGTQVSWYKQLHHVPQGFSLILAHEFFDAMPIHKFQRDHGMWKEVLVDTMFTRKGHEFRYVLSRGQTAATKLLIPRDEVRDHMEVSVVSMSIMEEISKRLMANGGIALVGDYGHEGQGTDTFRAFRNYNLTDPLVEPGFSDLTADVDFSLLEKAATAGDRTVAFGTVTQREFLLKLGMEERLQELVKQATHEQKDTLNYAFAMMTDPTQMGHRFKFMSFFPAVLRKHLKNCPVVGFH